MFFNFNNALDNVIAVQNFLDNIEPKDIFKFNPIKRSEFPQLNLLKDENEVQVQAEMPGVKKEDLEIEIKGDHLTIKGKREFKYGDDINCIQLERRTTEFKRSIKLPFRVDSDKVQAELKNGVLLVTISRQENDKPKTILVS